MRRLISIFLIFSVIIPFCYASAESTDQVEIVLSLAGDCILGSDEPLHGAADSFVGIMRANGNDYSYPLSLAQDFFANDDYTLINLECVLTDKRQGRNNELFTNFRGPADYVNILIEGSVEGVSLSNNHALDYSQLGLADCQKNLDAAGIQWAYNQTYFTFERKGIKFAVFSFRRSYMETYYTWLEKEMQRLRTDEDVDFIVVCLHHGVEYEPRHNDYDQERFAHHAIDYGADLVVGTHPHVLQGIEVYKNRLIFYSLGNFSFGGNKEVKEAANPTAVMEIRLTFSQSELYSSQLVIHPFHESGTSPKNNYQPTPVSGDEAQDVMKRLQDDTPFTLKPYIDGEGAVQDIIYAN